MVLPDIGILFIPVGISAPVSDRVGVNAETGLNKGDSSRVDILWCAGIEVDISGQSGSEGLAVQGPLATGRVNERQKKHTSYLDSGWKVSSFNSRLIWRTRWVCLGKSRAWKADAKDAYAMASRTDERNLLVATMLSSRH